MDFNNLRSKDQNHGNSESTTSSSLTLQSPLHLPVTTELQISANMSPKTSLNVSHIFDEDSRHPWFTSDEAKSEWKLSQTSSRKTSYPLPAILKLGEGELPYFYDGGRSSHGVCCVLTDDSGIEDSSAESSSFYRAPQNTLPPSSGVNM